MDERNTMEYLCSMFVAIFLLSLNVNCSSALSGCLFTDLIDILGTHEPCHSTYNNTWNRTAQNLLHLSHMEFYRIEDSTQNVTNHCTTYTDDATLVQYDWSCFLSIFGHGATTETGWYFVSCAAHAQHVIGTTCMNGTERGAVITKLCGISDVKQTCLAMDEISVCSRNFVIDKCPHDKNTQLTVSLTTSYDIAAYICIVFILSAFLIAICVPIDRCAPRQREIALRVPLCIYEMYGWPKRNSKPAMTRNDKAPAIAITVTDVNVENNNNDPVPIDNNADITAMDTTPTLLHASEATPETRGGALGATLRDGRTETYDTISEESVSIPDSEEDIQRDDSVTDKTFTAAGVPVSNENMYTYIAKDRTFDKEVISIPVDIPRLPDRRISIC